jgi:hypothetical protein
VAQAIKRCGIPSRDLTWMAQSIPFQRARVVHCFFIQSKNSFVFITSPSLTIFGLGLGI